MGLAFEALRSLPVALLVVRSDGAILLANRRAGAVLERDVSELEALPVASFLAPLAVLESPASHDERSGKLRVTLPSGRAAWIGFSIAELRSLDGAGDGRARAIVLKDLTEVERLREERDRLLQIATVHEVLPSILHEVKNPLAAIATTAELLVEEAEGEQARREAHAILQEARRMKLTLQGIGAVGRSLATSRPAAVDQAIREACAVLEARAESLGLHCRWSVRDLPLLPLDPSVVSALVLNLVTNAIQASRPGGVIDLTASLEGSGAALLLRVADTGSGMTPEVLVRCRELFFTTKPRGTGIGLALCHRAVTEAGGSMEIDSAPDQGTRIALRIPLPANRGKE
jgi:two-component system sensor histidine kinase HydH